MDNAGNEIYQVPALSIDPRGGISRSASETDVCLLFLPMTVKFIKYHSSFLSFMTFYVAYPTYKTMTLKMGSRSPKL